MEENKTQTGKHNHKNHHRGHGKGHGHGKGNRPAAPAYKPPYAEELLARGIETLGLSEATLRPLQAGRFAVVGDIVCRRQADMYRVQNFGKRNLNELTAALKRLGVDFRPVEEVVVQTAAKGRPDGKQAPVAKPQESIAKPQEQGEQRREKNKNKEKNKHREEPMTLERAFPKPKLVHSAPDEMPVDIYTKFHKGGKWGFKETATGREVIPAIYDEVFAFKDEYACVERKGLFGYINRENELVIPYRYECASSFSEGYACVSDAEKCGYINKQGEVVVPFIYDAGTAVTDGLAKVKKAGKWGTLNIATGELSWA